jgi:hypothetical protein
MICWYENYLIWIDKVSRTESSALRLKMRSMTATQALMPLEVVRTIVRLIPVA